MATTAESDKHDDDQKSHPIEGEGGHEAAVVERDEGDDRDDLERDEEAAAEERVAAPAAPKRPGARSGRRAPPPRKGGALWKSMLLFVLIVGGLAVAFAFLGKETGENGPAPAPKWKNGQQVDVEITLVASDAKDLSCAFADEIAGKHCAFEGENKPWTKGDITDDKKVLRPYTTVDRIQFLAAGLWSDPGMAAAKLPAVRFSVKCKLTVDGAAKKSSVRWNPEGPWYARADELYVGSISGCKIIQ